MAGAADLTLDRKWLGRLMMTVAFLILAIVPSVFDFNETHVYHPGWPGHARFHLVWSMGVLSLNAAVGLYFVWVHQLDRQFGIRMAGILGLGSLMAFFASMLAMPLYSGALHDAGGVPRLMGHDPNSIGFALTAALLLWGMRLARDTDPW